jgi:hypothetical protein
MASSNLKISECYSFDASEQTVEIKDDDFVSWVSITHVDSGKLIYHVDRDDRNGTSFNHTLNLEFNTANMTDNEPLNIVYVAGDGVLTSRDSVLLQRIVDELEITNKLLKKILC